MADEVLQTRLKHSSAYFNSLVRLVPAKFYLPDDDEEKSKRFYKNRGKAAPKQLIKEVSKKAKKKRLDPNQAKNVIDLQEQQENTKEESDQIDSEDESNNNSKGISVEKLPSGKIADLRARLHERIEMLQGKRKASDKSDKNSKRPKKKMKSEVKSDKKKMNEISQNKKEQSNKSTNKVTNDQGEVVFSKFDFMEKNKNPKHGSKMRDYKNLISKAEKRKKKVEEMKGQDVNKAREMEEKHVWKSAMEKAEGHKVKDDPKLLKKSLKRKEKIKAKSKRQWDTRKEQQTNQMEEKQKRRQKNLKERADSKKGKKPGKGKKHRPGF